tara:strand:+ start:2617 stop:3189 length:573 start_codon:yes stop_codon:yes gene_type:complete
MKKKSILYDFDWINSQNDDYICDEKDCNNIGSYLAPKSPGSKEMYVFCLDHIKVYNKRWNFFAGKSQKQIYEFQKNDFFDGRPTRPFSKGLDSKIKFEFENLFDEDDIKFKKKKRKNYYKKHKFNAGVEKSLKIFKMNPTFSEFLLKKRYKELVKKYHPDLNKNYLNKEKKIKEINGAYNILLKFVKDKK